MPQSILFLTIAATSYLLSFNAEGQSVTPWVTNCNKSLLFQKQAIVDFAPDPVSNPSTITINQNSSFQAIDGFGYCLTEGSAEAITSLASTQQDDLLRAFFDTINGIGVSILRISIGASDLSSSDYSYDEVASGVDLSLTNFSLSGPDLNYLIPILKKILTINPEIKILATPWTAPRWMKTNKAWIGGSLNTDYYNAYATYFVKYLDEMKAQGINIWAITPQNEPENPNNEPSMTMTSAEETNFINSSLGPAIRNAGYSTKIIAYDHNCDDTNYPTYVCNNSSYVDGSAFHLYAGSINTLSTVHNVTGKNVYFTEQYTGVGGNFSGDLSWHLQNVMIGSVLNWAKTAIEWNFATNSSYGPHTPGGCNTCLGAVTVNNTTSYSFNVSYYIVAHMSRFIRSNALRIESTGTNSDLVNAAFKNPDGSVALVVNNKGTSAYTFKVNFGSVAFTYTISAASVASFIWNNSPVSGIGSRSIADQNNKIQLIPNPVSNILTISYDTRHSFSDLRIVDINGHEVYHLKIKMGIEYLKVNVSLLQSGTYVLVLNGNNISRQATFIKR